MRNALIILLVSSVSSVAPVAKATASDIESASSYAAPVASAPLDGDDTLLPVAGRDLPLTAGDGVGSGGDTAIIRRRGDPHAHGISGRSRASIGTHSRPVRSEASCRIVATRQTGRPRSFLSSIFQHGLSPFPTTPCIAKLTYTMLTCIIGRR